MRRAAGSSSVVSRSGGRRGALHWAVLAFLFAFTVLLVLLLYSYLAPAADAAQGASGSDKAKLRAVSMLLLAVVLTVLLIGLLLTFRLGRLLVRPGKPTKTEYVDAWSESAKRLQVPPRGDEDDSESSSRG